ncbi:MAG: hypothetical protein FJY29_12060 [Betaproteobacteria bacterium]|nr:hypothetical protein [Betaproteobacteria bacterium]
MTLMRKSFFALLPTLLLVGVFLPACKSRNFGEETSEVDSLLDPHRLPARGPWFEGWYVRITPVSGTDRSLGAIVGSYLPPGEDRSLSEKRGLRGYAALLESGQVAAPLRAFEAFPEKTNMFLNAADPVKRDPAPSSPASFRWVADNLGEMNQSGLDLSVGGAQLKVNWSEPVPWNSSGFGPQGLLSLFRAFPLHWFVYSLASRVKFEAVLPDASIPEKFERISGTGYAHIEKNWGVSFPESYIWMQAHYPEQKRTIALAGGKPLKIAGVQPEAWLIGYRSERFKQDFTPQNVGTFFESKVDACAGRFELKASYLNRRLIITAQAPRKTFAGISIPKESGFERDGSEQSFQTQIAVQLFEVPPLGVGIQGEKLLEQTVLMGGALEFGGTYKCQK